MSSDVIFLFSRTLIVCVCVIPVMSLINYRHVTYSKQGVTTVRSHDRNNPNQNEIFFIF